MQRVQRKTEQVGPRERIAEGDTIDVAGEGEGADARIERAAIGTEDNRRHADALGNTRVSARVGLVHSDLVIGEHIGQRLQIAPRITRGTLGSDEDAVTGLPSDRTAAAGEDERQRRDGTRRRLCADHETTVQGVRNTRVGIERKESAVETILAET